MRSGTRAAAEPTSHGGSNLRSAACALILALLAGCGQKGPLIQPSPAGQTGSPSGDEAPAQEEREDDDER